VKLCARVANLFRQHRFNIHVNVFERLIPVEFSRFDFCFDRTQAMVDLPLFIGG